MEYLIQSYLRSVHWFLVIIHEPTFRCHYKQIVSSGVALGSRRGPLAVLILVLAIGAKHVRRDEAKTLFPLTDFDTLQQSLVVAIQTHYIELMDEGELETVQICLLLSSFYLLHGRPSLAFIILGTGVRSAQALGLYRESMWQSPSPVVVEIRRRLWWALYCFDRSSHPQSCV